MKNVQNFSDITLTRFSTYDWTGVHVSESKRESIPLWLDLEIGIFNDDLMSISEIRAYSHLDHIVRLSTVGNRAANHKDTKAQFVHVDIEWNRRNLKRDRNWLGF